MKKKWPSKSYLQLCIHSASIQHYAMELTSLSQPGVEEMPSADIVSRGEQPDKLFKCCKAQSNT